MNEVYRGHEIILTEDHPQSAVIIERQSGAALPTKVTAWPDEGEGACKRRARQLIDLYLDRLTSN